MLSRSLVVVTNMQINSDVRSVDHRRGEMSKNSEFSKFMGCRRKGMKRKLNRFQQIELQARWFVLVIGLCGCRKVLRILLLAQMVFVHVDTGSTRANWGRK